MFYVNYFNFKLFKTNYYYQDHDKQKQIKSPY